MPKELLIIKDFRGGLNDDSDAKDIKLSEFTLFENLTNIKKGQLRQLGGFTELSTDIIAGINREYLNNPVFDNDTYSDIIPGQGLFSVTSNASLGPPQNSTVSFDLSRGLHATDGEYAYAEFEVVSVVWVSDDSEAYATNGTLRFTMSVEDGPANIDGGAWDVVSPDQSGINFLNDTTFSHDAGNITPQNTASKWNINKQIKNKVGYTNSKILSNETFAGYGFYKYEPMLGWDGSDVATIYLPYYEHKVGGVKNHNMNYLLMRDSFIDKLVALINAATTSPNITAEDVGDQTGRIKLTTGAVGTALNGKAIQGALTGNSLSGITLKSSPDIYKSNRTGVLGKSSGGSIIVSGDTTFNGGVAAAADTWVLTISAEEGSGVALHVNINMNAGSGHQGRIRKKPFIWSSNAAAISSQIEAVIDAISGVTATVSSVTTNSATITVVAAAGKTNGFKMSYTVNNPILHSMPSFDTYGASENHVFFISRSPWKWSEAVGQNDETDIYGRSYKKLYPNLPSPGSPTQGFGPEMQTILWQVYSTATGAWEIIGEDTDRWNKTMTTEAVDAGGIGDWLWLEDSSSNNSLYSPDILWSTYKGTVRAADANFKMGNQPHSIFYIDRTDMFKRYPIKLGNNLGGDYQEFLNYHINQSSESGSNRFSIVDGKLYSYNSYCEYFENGQFNKWYKYPSGKDWRNTSNLGVLGTDVHRNNNYYNPSNSKWMPRYEQQAWDGTSTETNVNGNPISANARQGLTFYSYDLNWYDSTGNLLEHSIFTRNWDGSDGNNTAEPWDDAELSIRWSQSYYIYGGGVQIDSNRNETSTWTSEDIVQMWAVNVYDDGSESLPKHRFRTGAHNPADATIQESGFDNSVINQDYPGPYNEDSVEDWGWNMSVSPWLEDNPEFFKLIVYYKPTSHASSYGYYSAFSDPRIVGIRLYMTKATDMHTIFYNVGLIDFRYGWIPEGHQEGEDPEYIWVDNRGHVQDSGTIPNTEIGQQNSGGALILGKQKVWSPSQTGLTHPWVTFKAGINIMHPPSGSTYDIINGFDPLTATTLECRWKCQTILDNRMYVGNVEVEESSSAYSFEGGKGNRKNFDDMVIYSPVGKLDIFPYPTNVLQVSTSDGDEIIELSNHNHKLFQFKRRYLYILDVSSGAPADIVIQATYPDRGVMSRYHVCKVPTGVFWFNKFGAYIHDGDNITNCFETGEEEDKYNRIDKETWADFVQLESNCSYNPESNEVIICKSHSTVENVSDPTNDIYVYNVVNNSWAFGDSRAKLTALDGASATTSLKSRTNFINIGDNDNLISIGYHGLVSHANYLNGTDLSYQIKYWQFKDYGMGQATDNFGFSHDGGTLITKIIDLGSPEVKKSILGMVANISPYLMSAQDFFYFNLYIRRGDGDQYQNIGSFNSQTSTDSSNYWQIKFNFSPPFKLDWSQMQLKIDFRHGYGTDIAVNDMYLIVRSYRDAIGKASADEEE